MEELLAQGADWLRSGRLAAQITAKEGALIFFFLLDFPMNFSGKIFLTLFLFFAAVVVVAGEGKSNRSVMSVLRRQKQERNKKREVIFNILELRESGDSKTGASTLSNTFTVSMYVDK